MALKEKQNLRFAMLAILVIVTVFATVGTGTISVFAAVNNTPPMIVWISRYTSQRI